MDVLKLSREDVSFKKVKSSSYLSLESLKSDKAASGFHDLPQNVLCRIFRYFSQSELRRTVMPVCRRWRRAAKQPELWKSLYFNGDKTPVAFICAQLRELSRLKAIHLRKVTDVSTVIRQMCRSNHRLEEICLEYCSDGPHQPIVPEGVLRYMIKTCRNLRKISLNGTKCSGKLLFTDLAAAPCLHSVNLSNNPLLRLEDLLTVVLNNPGLEELRLSKQPELLSDQDAIIIFNQLKKSLMSLTFDANGLSDVTFRSIIECSNLRRLCLNNCTNLRGEAFMVIWSNLSGLKQLATRRAELLKCQHLMRLSFRGPALHHLDLSGCWRIGSRGLESLAERCPGLAILILKGCKSLTTIAFLPNFCKSLKLLNVAFCPLLLPEEIRKVSVSLDLQRLIVDCDRRYQAVIKDLAAEREDLEILLSTSEFHKGEKYYKKL